MTDGFQDKATQMRQLMRLGAVGFAVAILHIASGLAILTADEGHPVPIDPYPHAEILAYQNALVEKFEMVRGRDAAVMLRKPAFDPEECISLEETRDQADKLADGTLIYQSTDKNIWYAKTWTRRDKAASTVKISRISVRFPSGLTGRILRLWKRLLLDTRYAIPEGLGVMDATIVEFWCGRMYGEVQNPEEVPTGGMTQLGQYLIGYCKAPGPDRPALLVKIEMKCKELEDYYAKTK